MCVLIFCGYLLVTRCTPAQVVGVRQRQEASASGQRLFPAPRVLLHARGRHLRALPVVQRRRRNARRLEGQVRPRVATRSSRSSTGSSDGWLAYHE